MTPYRSSVPTCEGLLSYSFNLASQGEAPSFGPPSSSNSLDIFPQSDDQLPLASHSPVPCLISNVDAHFPFPSYPPFSLESTSILTPLTRWSRGIVPATETLLQGALDKKNNRIRFPSWKRRWFILKDTHCLLEYSSRFSSHLLGTIPLTSTSDIIPDPSNPLVFRIVQRKEHPKQGSMVVLRAGSAESRAQWVHQLQHREKRLEGKGSQQDESASNGGVATINPSADVRSIPTASPKGEVPDANGVSHWLDY